MTATDTATEPCRRCDDMGDGGTCTCCGALHGPMTVTKLDPNPPLRRIGVCETCGAPSAVLRDDARHLDDPADHHVVVVAGPLVEVLNDYLDRYARPAEPAPSVVTVRDRQGRL